MATGREQTLKAETFELYNQSGTPRTIRLKAWAIADKQGVLRSYNNTPYVHLSEKYARGLKRKRGEKVVSLEVRIRAEDAD